MWLVLVTDFDFGCWHSGRSVGLGGTFDGEIGSGEVHMFGVGSNLGFLCFGLPSVEDPE